MDEEITVVFFFKTLSFLVHAIRQKLKSILVYKIFIQYLPWTSYDFSVSAT